MRRFNLIVLPLLAGALYGWLHFHLISALSAAPAIAALECWWERKAIVRIWTGEGSGDKPGMPLYLFSTICVALLATVTAGLIAGAFFVGAHLRPISN